MDKPDDNNTWLLANQDNTNPDFDPIEGGWLENPFGITMDDINEIIENTNLSDNAKTNYLENIADPEAFNDKDTLGNPSLFIDQNRGFSTMGVTKEEIDEYNLNMSESGSVYGCFALKIACIILGVFGLILLMFVIVVSFLNQNTVICPDKNNTCQTCPICPSSVTNMNTEEVDKIFYLRDRVSLNGIFQVEGNIVSSKSNNEGTMFVLSGGVLRALPGGKYITIGDEDNGGFLIVTDKQKNLKDFYIENRQLMYGNYRIIYIENSGNLFLYAISKDDNISYKYIPALFKQNPNTKITNIKNY